MGRTIHGFRSRLRVVLNLISSNLLPRSLAGQCLFRPGFFARFQIVRVTLHFLDDVFLLDFALKTSKSILQGLTFLQSNFCHTHLISTALIWAQVKSCATPQQLRIQSDATPGSGAPAREAARRPELKSCFLSRSYAPCHRIIESFMTRHTERRFCRISFTHCQVPFCGK